MSVFIRKTKGVCMKKIFIQYQKLLFCMCAVCIVIAGGIYYFGIQHAFVPNSEDLSNTQWWYLILNMDQSYSHKNLVLDFTSCLSVMIGGMSYLSVRLEFALLYMMVLGLSLYLSVSEEKNRKQWFVLPLWAFFMILIHTVGNGSDFGKVYAHTDLIYQLPYSYHMVPLIFALISTIILQKYLCVNAGIKKKIIGTSGIIVVLYALLFTDLIFIV